ncbi:MAG TPA: hypothetical protein VK724_10790 [Bryobacteraceae bacterium]|nr:hypothetical protein [Bryobacteraceae bacterium]
MNLSRFGSAFDYLYAEQRRALLDRLVVWVSIAGFVIHLGLVFLASTLPSPPASIAAVGTNYLSAIYTPFSFILFYEVLMLIAALPQSTTQSIAKQYEIISLIFIRSFFKEIAELHGIGKLATMSPDVVPVFGNLGAGLLMFLLVTVFLHAASQGTPIAPGTERGELAIFIVRKKVIALALTILLVTLAVRRVIEFVGFAGGRENINSFFYTDVFMVMIFTDVLIVILSLVVSDRYELVFRNAAFVISTILIRFSLTAEWPYGALLALMGMLVGIFTLIIYNYHRRIGRAH